MKVICIIGILFLAAKGYTQIKSESLSIDIGGVAYSGDLSHNYDSWSQFYSIGLKLSGNVLSGGKIQLIAGNVSGNSLKGVQGQHYFNTPFFGLNYLFNLKTPYKNWALNVSSGPGLLFFYPKDEQGNLLIDNDTGRVPGEYYRNASLSIDNSISLQYLFDNGFAFQVSSAFLLPFSDYVDNISEAANDINRDNLVRLGFGIDIPIPTNTNQND